MSRRVVADTADAASVLIWPKDYDGHLTPRSDEHARYADPLHYALGALVASFDRCFARPRPELPRNAETPPIKQERGSGPRDDA